jgi:hypothetical protein
VSVFALNKIAKPTMGLKQVEADVKARAKKR